MSQLPSVDITRPSDQPFGAQNTLNELNLDTFLQLMIAELQNQDPLNPLENDELLAQISQIREVGATERLTETLDSVLLGQNIASATNLIGADIQAISDDGQRVEGFVDRISIDGGKPKLHLELNSTATPWRQPGNVEAGTYSYRVVWEDDQGNVFGIDLPPVVTTGGEGVDTSIRLSNLPTTRGPKQVYRTDASGRGDFHLVGTIDDGGEGSFVDTLADDERFTTVQDGRFQRLAAERSFVVSLNNVSEIRPPRR